MAVTPHTEVIRQRHIARFRELLPEQLTHLDWTSEELRQAQDRGLRRIVRFAAERSPWHHERLASVDVSALTAADLSSLPVMTKSSVTGPRNPISIGVT